MATKKSQTHEPANLTIDFIGGDTKAASEAVGPLLEKFSKKLAAVDAPLSSTERAMVGTFVLWLLEEGELDTEPLKVTRTIPGVAPDAEAEWESGIT